MFENLEILRMATAMASHAGARQALVAQNVANADTPGYRTRDLEAFSTSYREADGDAAMRSTRSGHLAPASPQQAAVQVIIPGGVSPNGNSVSLEAEMVRAVDVRQEHDLALSVYQSSMDILRAAIGRAR